MESGGLYTPNGGKRGRRGAGYMNESREEDFMDISSAARDLRELSQVSVGADEKSGAGGGRAPSSGRVRSSGPKSGTSKGWGGHPARVVLEAFIGTCCYCVLDRPPLFCPP